MALQQIIDLWWGIIDTISVHYLAGGQLEVVGNLVDRILEEIQSFVRPEFLAGHPDAQHRDIQTLAKDVLLHNPATASPSLGVS